MSQRHLGTRLKLKVKNNMDIVEKRKIVANHQLSAPIQTVPLAEELGLKVWHVPSWEDHISGMILKNKDQGGSSGYAIYVNKKHHINRRRFTTAHEIAHFVLHENLIGDGITDDALYRSKLTGGIEAQANKYAAEILMPLHLINKALAEGINSIDALATKFEVSKSSMSIRMGVPYDN